MFRIHTIALAFVALFTIGTAIAPSTASAQERGYVDSVVWQDPPEDVIELMFILDAVLDHNPETNEYVFAAEVVAEGETMETFVLPEQTIPTLDELGMVHLSSFGGESYDDCVTRRLDTCHEPYTYENYPACFSEGAVILDPCTLSDMGNHGITICVGLSFKGICYGVMITW